MFNVRLLLAKLLDSGAGRAVGGRGGRLCLFKEQARMSAGTSLQVFWLCWDLVCVCVYVGSRAATSEEQRGLKCLRYVHQGA